MRRGLCVRCDLSVALFVVFAAGAPTRWLPVQAAQAKNAGNFSNTVFLGDSLTAGYQSGSLLDTLQVHGWAPRGGEAGESTYYSTR